MTICVCILPSLHFLFPSLNLYFVFGQLRFGKSEPSVATMSNFSDSTTASTRAVQSLPRGVHLPLRYQVRVRSSEMPKESEMASQKQKLTSPLQRKSGSPESGGAASRRSSRSLSESPCSRLKKGGSRVADLERKLAQAQDQIKKLKEKNGEDGEEGAEEKLKEKLAEAESKIRETVEEAEASRVMAEQLGKKVEAMDAEMRTLRVQTDQWRKAAEAAAAALAAATAGENGRAAERCRSLEKSLGIGLDDGSPMNEGGRRKNGGIRVLGDLWRKTAALSKPSERR